MKRWCAHAHMGLRVYRDPAYNAFASLPHNSAARCFFTQAQTLQEAGKFVHFPLPREYLAPPDATHCSAVVCSTHPKGRLFSGVMPVSCQLNWAGQYSDGWRWRWKSFAPKLCNATVDMWPLKQLLRQELPGEPFYFAAGRDPTSI